jgi:hypothetical protein
MPIAITIEEDGMFRCNIMAMIIVEVTIMTAETG